MKILGIESSAGTAGAAIVCNGELKAEFNICNGLTHSQTLMPLVDSVLKMANMDINEIDIIAVSSGPGSFTGLRIGIGTAKGLALGADKMTVGVSPLLALAYNIAETDRLILPIMDARRGEVYNGVYKYEDGKICTVTEPRALPIDALLDEYENEKVVFVGDGVPVHRERIIKRMGSLASFAPLHSTGQRAASVAAAALQLKAVPPEELAPFYIRKPQAERELEEKLKKEQGEQK